MIFVDSYIPMYLVGAPHPDKDAARVALERIVNRGEKLVTSAEAMQEILHRYGALERPDAIEPAFDALHVAVMKRRGVARVLSFDAGFDAVGWVERVS